MVSLLRRCFGAGASAAPLAPADFAFVGLASDLGPGAVFGREVALGAGGGLLGLRAVLPSTSRALIANADALIDLDVRALLARDPMALSTLVLKAVDDVARYGALGTDDDDRIVSFAGRITPLGAANRLLLSGEARPTSLRPFARFNELAGRVFVHPRARVDDRASLVGPCVIDDGAVIEANAVVGPWAVIGPRVIVRPGVVVERAVVQSALDDGVNIISRDAIDVHVDEGHRVPLRGL